MHDSALTSEEIWLQLIYQQELCRRHSCVASFVQSESSPSTLNCGLPESYWLAQESVLHNPLDPRSQYLNWNPDCAAVAGAVVAAAAVAAAAVTEVAQRLWRNAADWNSHYYPNFPSLQNRELSKIVNQQINI